MAGPWEKYAAPAAPASPAPAADGPWAKYQPAPAQDAAPQPEPVAGLPAPAPGSIDQKDGYDFIVGHPEIRAKAINPNEDPEGAYAERTALRARADNPTLAGVVQKTAPVYNGLTGGFGDELSSVIGAGVDTLRGKDFGTSYRRNQEIQQQALDAETTAHPYLTPAQKVIGGAATAIAAAPFSATEALAGAALPARILGGAADAGVMGATQGAGDAPPGERLKGAAQGFVTGAATGAALYPVAAGASRLISGAINYTADQLARIRALQGLGLSRPSAEILMRSTEADPNAAAQIAGAGPQGMLADAGPATAGVLDTAIQRGGPGATEARRAIEQRAGQGAADINTALDQSLGAPQGIDTTTTAIRQGSAPARQAAYDAAYNTPIDYSRPEAFQLQNTLLRVPGPVINRANQLMQLEGVQSRQINAIINPDGTITYQRLPDVRQLDYITRALNDVAQRGDGMGALGGNTAEGRAYGNLSRDIRQGLRTLVPEYGAALDTAAEPIAARNALDFGSRLLSPAVARDEVVNTLRGMSVPERDALRQGIRSQIDEKLANVKRSITDPNVDGRQAIAAIKDFSSDAARTKLRIVLGQPQADQLLTQIDTAARAFELRAATAANSRTFGRTATAEGVKEASAPNAFSRFMAGEPLQAGKASMQFLTGFGPQRQAETEDRIYNEISRALTERRGADALRLLQQLQQANTITGRGAQAAQTLGALARVGTLGAGAPLAVRNRDTLSGLLGQ